MGFTNWQDVGRKSAKLGNAHQDAALIKLRNLKTIAMVERIETGFRIIRRGSRMIPIPVARVAGDFRALIPGCGQSVLIEQKAREDKLLWSDFEDHQIEALDIHAHNGGLSLVLWSGSHGFHLFKHRESYPDFRKGKGLSVDSLITLPDLYFPIWI